MSYLKKEILKTCISILDIRYKEINCKYTSGGRLDSPTFSKWINGNKSVRLPSEQLNEIIKFIVSRIDGTGSSVEILLLEQLYERTDADFPRLAADTSGKYLLSIPDKKYKEIQNYLKDKRLDNYIAELILLEHEVYYDKYLKSLKNNVPDKSVPVCNDNSALVNVVNGSFIDNKVPEIPLRIADSFLPNHFFNVKKPGTFIALIAALILTISAAFVIYLNLVASISTILERPFIAKITSPYSNQAQIVWNYTPDNEDGFIIERKEAGGKFELLEKITDKRKYYDSGNKENYYIDKEVSAGKEYFYRVKVFNATGESAYSKSIPVMISSVEPPKIKITSVGKNEAWFQGDAKKIEWVMEGDISHVDYLKIACIYDSVNKQVDIATLSSVETRSFQWEIPQTVASSSARIRIKAFDKNAFHICSDMSDYFSIGSR